MKRPGLLLLLVLALLMVAGAAYAMSSRNFRLDWYDPLSSTGGPQMISSGFTSHVTAGQPAVAASSSTNYAVRLGYWSGLLRPPAPLLPGAFLPLVLRQPTPTPTPTPTVQPVPGVPSLNAILPPEAGLSYAVSWLAAERAEGYVLERATGPSFVDTTEVYAGPATSYPAASEGIATYHYRVKARNVWGDGGWSNVQLVEVRWEHEPNEQIPELDSRSRLMFGQVHYGAMAADRDIDPDSLRGRDYFYFDLDTSRTVELWLGNIPAGSNYDLYVRPDWDILTIIGYSAKPGNADEYVKLDALLAGHRYFVQVYNRDRVGSTQPYRLTIQ